MKNRKLKILLPLAAIIIAAAAAFFWNKNEERIISYANHEFGPIWIYEQNNIRCMTFTKPPTPIVQSCINLENPKLILFNYTQMFLSTLLIKDNPQKILIIGMGGATMPHAFRSLTPNAHVDIVEIHPKIPEMAEQYFDYKTDKKSKIYIEDGFEFAKNAPAETYDIILLDAFSPKYIPPSLLTSEFMNNVKKMMKPDAVVAMNTFRNTKYRDLEAKLFKDAFGTYYNLETSQSRVMLATKGKTPYTEYIKEQALNWRFRFSELGVDANALYSLFEGSKR